MMVYKELTLQLQDLLELQVLRGPQDLKVMMEMWVLILQYPDQRDHKALKVQRVMMEIKAFKVFKESKESKESVVTYRLR
jgi:hypothetical protein